MRRKYCEIVFLLLAIGGLGWAMHATTDTVRVHNNISGQKSYWVTYGMNILFTNLTDQQAEILQYNFTTGGYPISSIQANFSNDKLFLFSPRNEVLRNDTPLAICLFKYDSYEEITRPKKVTVYNYRIATASDSYVPVGVPICTYDKGYPGIFVTEIVLMIFFVILLFSAVRELLQKRCEGYSQI